MRYCMRTEVHVYAFAIAANVLLSFFPFLIVMLSLARAIFGERVAVGAIQLALRDYFPDALGQFLIRNLPRTGRLQLVSLVLLLFTANGVFEPLEVALNRIWGIRTNRSFFRNQLVSLVLIFVCGGLVLMSLVLTGYNQQSFQMERFSPGPMAPYMAPFQSLASNSGAWFSELFFKLAAIPVSVLVLFLIYRYLPNGRPPLTRVFPAALGAGLLLEGLKYVNTWLWPGFQHKIESEYGVFQYSVTLIFLSFMASMIVLGGAEWSARGQSLDERLETDTNVDAQVEADVPKLDARQLDGPKLDVRQLKD
jgi:membrane protein